MFRAGNVPGARAPTVHQTSPVICDVGVVEHLVNVPLWFVQAMPMPDQEVAEADDGRLWERYLVSDSEVLAEMITSQRWEEFQLHVVLPSYVTGNASPSIERCTSIWNGVVTVEDEDHPTWYFKTESREFLDILRTGEGARKISLLWEAEAVAPEAVGGAADLLSFGQSQALV